MKLFIYFLLLVVMSLGKSYYDLIKRQDQVIEKAAEYGALGGCRYGIERTCVNYVDCSTVSIEELQERICK